MKEEKNINNLEKNQKILLVPITLEEKQKFEHRFMGDEELYVLYCLDNELIHIGMLSSFEKIFHPEQSNLDKLKDATNSAYFYILNIKKIDEYGDLLIERPIYEINYNNVLGDKIVSDYEIINKKYKNNLDIDLLDVVRGQFEYNEVSSYCFKKFYKSQKK